MIRVFSGMLLILLLQFSRAWASPVSGDMALLPTGTYFPFFAREGRKKREPVEVKAFWIDRNPVTNRQFLLFVKKYPEWRKSKVKPLFADSHYLEGWNSDFGPRDPRELSSPATHVSWFAAEAFCESQGKELPTSDQWEYALYDQGRNHEKVKEKILAWYGKPNSLTATAVGGAAPNGFGVYDLAGLIWEWTLDFNDQVGESQDAEGKSLFCGNGSLGALDASDYASFMRYSFRSSLKASYTTGNLGFRCAKETL